MSFQWSGDSQVKTTRHRILRLHRVEVSQSKTYELDSFDTVLRASPLLSCTPFPRLPRPPPHGETLKYGIMMMVQRNYCFTYGAVNVELAPATLSSAEEIEEELVLF